MLGALPATWLVLHECDVEEVEDQGQERKMLLGCDLGQLVSCAVIVIVALGRCTLTCTVADDELPSGEVCQVNA